MPTLLITRPRDGGAVLRRLRVEVGGREVAALKQRESVAVPVAAGVHSLRARMDWTSSPALEVAIAEGHEVRIEVAMPFSVLWNMVLRPRSALSIKRR